MEFYRLKEIGKLIKEQDNRITDAPLFIVEQTCRDYGYSRDYSDKYVWINPNDDHTEADKEQAEKLDTLYNEGSGTGNWERVYYKDRWEFVTACFTEQGCKNYISSNGHNLKKPRIFAASSYRNNEYRTVREYLLTLHTEKEIMVCNTK